MPAASKKALGKGLASLIRDAVSVNPPVAEQESKTENISYVSLAQLQPGRFQPRQKFDPQLIEELAESIKSSGIVQPILVRPQASGYEIIAGERRFRAAQRAQLHKVPVIIRETSDTEALKIALIENLQRAQLNPVEEAAALEKLHSEFNHDQLEIAAMIGKSRSYVANMVRLLTLPEKVQDMIMSGQLSAGHARALIVASDPEALAKIIIEKKLSVREAEKLTAKSPRAAHARAWHKKYDENIHVKEIAKKEFIKNLSRTLGLAVSIHEIKKGGGELRIRYRSLGQLESLAKKLSAS